MSGMLDDYVTIAIIRALRADNRPDSPRTSSQPSQNTDELHQGVVFAPLVGILPGSDSSTTID